MQLTFLSLLRPTTTPQTENNPDTRLYSQISVTAVELGLIVGMDL